MSLPVDIYLMRHFQSVGNVIARRLREGTLEPSDDTAEIVRIDTKLFRLSEDGLQKGARARDWIEQKVASSFGHFACSPYHRAIESAVILDFPDAHWQLVDELRERDWGVIDQLPHHALGPFEEYFERRKLNRYWFTPPGGESVEMAGARAYRWLMDFEVGEKDSLFVVSHHDTLAGLMAKLLHISGFDFHTLQVNRLLSPLRFQNGEIAQLTRRHPQAHNIRPSYDWYRMIHPGEDHISEWIEIVRPGLLSTSELAAMLATPGE